MYKWIGLAKANKLYNNYLIANLICHQNENISKDAIKVSELHSNLTAN